MPDVATILNDRGSFADLEEFERQTAARVNHHDHRQKRNRGWGLPPNIARASASREPKKPTAPTGKPAPAIAQAAALPSIEIAGRALAKFVSYNGLWNAVRARVEAMGITRIGTDTLSKLPDGYTGKLLGAAQVRKISLNSLERILEGTGCYLVLVEDAVATETILATAKEMHLFRRGPPRAQKLLPPPSPRP
jgi:hypothetical protein